MCSNWQRNVNNVEKGKRQKRHFAVNTEHWTLSTEHWALNTSGRMKNKKKNSASRLFLVECRNEKIKVFLCARQFARNLNKVNNIFIFFHRFSFSNLHTWPCTLCAAWEDWIEIVKWTTEHSFHSISLARTAHIAKYTYMDIVILLRALVLLYFWINFWRTTETPKTNEHTRPEHPCTRARWMETSILPFYSIN